MARSIAKSNDIGVVVVLEELAIDAQDFLIVDKHIGDFADAAAIGGSHLDDPSLDSSTVEVG